MTLQGLFTEGELEVLALLRDGLIQPSPGAAEEEDSGNGEGE
jgi:hypothetical protein